MDYSYNYLFKKIRYLEGFAPAKEFLPVVISISVLGKEVSIPNVSISRTDSVEELKKVIERRLAENGNPVHSWTKNCAFILKNPLASEDDSSVVIVDTRLPIVQYGAQQGSELVVKGLILESDKPKTCFTANYTSGATTDYYSCKDCNINCKFLSEKKEKLKLILNIILKGVCSDCASVCHAGHKIVDYLKNHKPTWNCCYCVKKRKCKLPNKNSK